MKKIASAFVYTLLLISLFTSCAIFPTRKTEISWPEKISYLEALCELDMSWRDMKYSGSMAIKMKHPDRLTIEVYGPFGETIIYLMKDGDKFSFVSRDEKVNDQAKFEERFGIKLNQFIDDMAMKDYRKRAPQGVYLSRENYVVTYELGDNKDRVCWKGVDGSICVRFLEAVFEEEAIE